MASAQERSQPAPDREALLRALARGRALDHAVVAQVRALNHADAHDEARSLAESLRQDPATRALGHLAGGIVAYRQGYVELAREELRHVPPEQRAALAAAEYVRAGLAVAPEETLREIRALVADDPPAVGPKSWFDILGAVHGHGAADDARAVFAVFDRRVEQQPGRWEAGPAHRDWMRPWVAADPDSRIAPGPPDGRPTFAVMDYGHPGPNRASANIGDHIQSVAALGHLVRHRGVRLHGREELAQLLNRLGERTRPERALRTVDADLDVITVHRDASMYQAIPAGTWVLCFGWYMHALFGIRHGFPLHDGLRPIFVSFHCNKRALLTPAAIEYLRRYGPVGCRDWTTVYLLLSIDVPAFFSGCLSTTIDSVFPDGPRPGADAPVGYVDAAPEDVPPGAVTYEHSSDAVRRRPFVTNVDKAVALLDTYRRRHRRIVTSRLHCYLPVRALGIDAEFRPANRSDVRFDGLIDLDDAAFAAMRDGMNAKLEHVFAAILEGRPEHDVYASWRELNAADVAAAEERRRVGHPLPEVPPALQQRAREVAAQTTTRRPAGGPAVDCAVILEPGGRRALAALIASLLEHASRPVHVWVLALPDVTKGDLPVRFPQAGFSWVPVRRLGRRLRTPAGEPPPPDQVARLMLPDLLPDVDRVALLPLPAVVTADAAELTQLDLGDHAIAAPTRSGTSGFELIHAAAKRLEDRTAAAAALRRTAHARHRFDFDAFTHDLLVLDLARLRRERFSSRALPLIEAFGLDDLEALHYLVGPERAAVPERWAAAPTRTPCREPGLLYWPDRVKPWQPELTPERDRWRHYDALARASGSTRLQRPR